eukprot:COSAG01_NODE_49384_length_372_cov_1.809524_1_plen_105_part_01
MIATAGYRPRPSSLARGSAAAIAGCSNRNRSHGWLVGRGCDCSSLPYSLPYSCTRLGDPAKPLRGCDFAESLARRARWPGHKPIRADRPRADLRIDCCTQLDQPK